MTEVMNQGDLIKQKFDIELRIKELGDILKEEGDVGMSGNIIDSEGYPRADVDIYKIRLTRQEINCLQNDYKDLLKKIEDQGLSLSQENKEALLICQAPDKLKPLLKITQVDTGSPSELAGLEKGDEIVQFGPITAANSSHNLSEISSYVNEREEKIILLKALRKKDDSDNQILRLKLIPKKWSGHGLLGCKLNYI